MMLVINERMPKLFDIQMDNGRFITCSGNKAVIRKLCELFGYDDIFKLFKENLMNSVDSIVDTLLED